MAQIDFSNAVLDVNGNSTPLTEDDYMSFNNTAYLWNSQGQYITSNQTKTIINNTPAKVSILYTGSFTTSGTEFYIGNGGGNPWKVSNISFSSGDTYSFVIDIEVSGNT